MSIPKMEAFMHPLLEALGDGQSKPARDCWDHIANALGITDEERARTLESGNQLVFVNRAAWASTYLSKAGLIIRPSRGLLQITARGRAALDDPSARIDKSFLKQFEEYENFRKRGTTEPNGGDSPGGLPDLVSENSDTPDEVVARGYQQFNVSLVDDVLARVRNVSPAFFERLVVELLVAMGYGGTFEDAANVVGKTGDGGIDGVIKEDRLGLDAIYVQAKRWQNPVGRSVVAEFVGSLAAKASRKGVLITTSTFTTDAIRWLQQVSGSIVLIDGQQLAELMVEHGVGVTPMRTYILKRIDNDYFDEEQ